MDEEISDALNKAKVNNDDPDRISFVSEEILFPLRQRIMDMQQMIVVNQQGIIAIEVIRRNNKELIIEHTQEVPEYKKIYVFNKLSNLVKEDLKIFIIDENYYNMILLAEEY